MFKEKEQSSVERVKQAIIENFRTGVYVPGQRLSEPELKEKFSVGRGSVREALKHLAGEGLVTINPYQGAFVRTLSKTEMLDTLRVLELLYGLAARQAAQRLSESPHAAALKKGHSDLLAAEESGDFYAKVRAREAFFDLVGKVSGNKELERVQPRLTLLVARIQVPHAMDENVRRQDYRLIGNAILDGDFELAEFAARRHIRHAILDVREASDQEYRAADSDEDTIVAQGSDV